MRLKLSIQQGFPVVHVNRARLLLATGSRVSGFVDRTRLATIPFSVRAGQKPPYTLDCLTSPVMRIFGNLSTGPALAEPTEWNNRRVDGQLGYDLVSHAGNVLIVCAQDGCVHVVAGLPKGDNRTGLSHAAMGPFLGDASNERWLLDTGTPVSLAMRNDPTRRTRPTNAVIVGYSAALDTWFEAPVRTAVTSVGEEIRGLSVVHVGDVRRQTAGEVWGLGSWGSNGVDGVIGLDTLMAYTAVFVPATSPVLLPAFVSRNPALLLLAYLASIQESPAQEWLVSWMTVLADEWGISVARALSGLKQHEVTAIPESAWWLEILCDALEARAPASVLSLSDRSIVAKARRLQFEEAAVRSAG